ncbi:hypothetical protein [Aliikangiella sp. G2MR2-5]|uniref:hypothetical protein n=1 Tax=Aliikangiella sp. G2MR2-5 TaxID=2788943 RepID=UPI0018AC84F2|nr:hypothetical protein [Aliikangiella sp. G2MR2-5]
MGNLKAEFALLYFIIDHMDENGLTYKLVDFSIDESMTEEVNNKFKTSFTLDELEKATDKCLSHEWVNYRAMGQKYGFLGITQKGVGVARSKRKSDELKSQRSWFKKFSDYIEDHKGVFILIGSIVALVTLSLKIFGE